MLDLKAAMDLIDTGKWLSVVYVSASTKQGEGGEVVRLKRCRKLTKTTANGSKTIKPIKVGLNETSRNPNHHEHFTVNLRLPNGRVRKAYVRLIRAINGQPVI